MKKQVSDIWTLLGASRQEDLFFKVYPDRIGTVTDVRMAKVACPGCGEKRRDAWVYLQQGDWLLENVASLCVDCEKDAYAAAVTKQLRRKHEQIIENDWYFIDEADDAGFKNFEPVNAATKAAKAKAMEYVMALRTGEARSLRIAGTPGTGKTHLAKAIARTVKYEGKRVAFVEAVTLFDKVKKMFGNERARERFDAHITGFDLVVIDDVGLETRKIADVSWTSSEWVRLIELRKGKSTVYTTNFEARALAEVIGARAESRMCEHAMQIDIFTPDEDYRRGTLFD